MGLVFDPSDASTVLKLRALEGATRALGIMLRPVEVRGAGDLQGAFARMASEHVDAIHVAGGPLNNTHAREIVQLVARARVPAVYARSLFVEAGGLMSYALDSPDQYHRTATFADKIFKGAKPADLPVELPTKFELIINRRRHGCGEVVRHPRSQRAGKSVVVKLQRPGDPGTLREQWWPAYERITMKRADTA